jgi:hypothetical protein
MNFLAARKEELIPQKAGQALKTASGELKENIGLYKVFYFRIVKIISY